MKNILGDAGTRRRSRFLMTADKVAGDAVHENGMVGILIDDAADTTEGVAYTETDSKGAKVVKATGVTISRYDPAYYHVANDNFTNAASGAVLCGHWAADAASGDTTGAVVLNQVMS